MIYSKYQKELAVYWYSNDFAKLDFVDDDFFPVDFKKGIFTDQRALAMSSLVIEGVQILIKLG